VTGKRVGWHWAQRGRNTAVRQGNRLRHVRASSHLLGAHIAPAADFALLLLLPPMTRHSAFAAGFTSFFARPLVRRSFLMRCFASLAGDLALFPSIHRSKSAVLFCHHILLPGEPWLPGSPRDLASGAGADPTPGCN
jgi:hypothetical protein